MALAPAATLPARLWEALHDRRVALVLIIGYCLAHFLIRLSLSPVYSLDEAEQVLFGQTLSLGYRFRHPPLITWLTALTQDALGLNLAGLMAMKYTIMALGFAALYEAARRVLSDGRLALLATFAFTLTYTIGYYPHVDLMHTVLLTTCLFAALWMTVRLLDDAGLALYALAGALIAAGVLAKYVFAVYPAAAALAIALTPSLRGRIRPHGAALMVAVALALLAPYGAWVLAYDYSFFTLARDITGADEVRQFFLLTAAQGTLALARALIEFTLPFLLFFVLLFPRALRPVMDQADARERDWLLLLERTMLIGAAMMLIGVWAVGATDFKSRWTHQVLIGLTVYLFLRLRLSDAERRPWRLPVFAGLILAVGLVAGTARIAAYALNAAGCGKCWEYQDFDAYAEAIRARGFTQGTIVTDTLYVGGNLRAHFQRSRVLTPGYPLAIFPEAAGDGGCLVAFMRRDDALPGALAAYLSDELGIDPGALPAPQRIVRPFLTEPARAGHLTVMVSPEALGACR